VRRPLLWSPRIQDGFGENSWFVDGLSQDADVVAKSFTKLPRCGEKKRSLRSAHRVHSAKDTQRRRRIRWLSRSGAPGRRDSFPTLAASGSGVLAGTPNQAGSLEVTARKFCAGFRVARPCTRTRQSAKTPFHQMGSKNLSYTKSQRIEKGRGDSLPRPFSCPLSLMPLSTSSLTSTKVSDMDLNRSGLPRVARARR
jgi:hypothetical protein